MSYKGKKVNRVCGVEEGYDIYAEQYNADVGYLNSFEKEVLITMLGDLRGLKVLDLGCGTGRLVHHLRNLGAEVVGVDVSEKMLEILKKRYMDVEVVCADVCHLPFEEDNFDVVIGSFLIVHIKDLVECFDEVYRVLKPSGHFYVTNINQRRAPKLKLTGGGEIIIESYYHRPEDVLASLEKSFFKIVKENFVRDGKVWVNQIVKTTK